MINHNPVCVRVCAGIQACKFLERRRVKKPGQTRYPVKSSEYWQAEDFYVGAEVEIEDFRFRLVDADEYAYRYMESHPEQVLYCFLCYHSVFMHEYIFSTVHRCVGLFSSRWPTSNA